MKSKWRTRLFAGTLAAAMFASDTVNVMAGDYTAAPDGMTEAEKLASDMGVSALWETWKSEWNSSVKTDWTQISLTPGSDEGQLNFAWYSKQGTTADTGDKTQKEISLQMESIVKEASPELAGNTVPKLIIGEGRSMRGAKVYAAEQMELAGETDAVGNTYYSNKVTATGLTAGKTYFYSYETENGIYTEPAEYTVTFMYNGAVFGTQHVKEGQCAIEPWLNPASTGSWDADFTEPVTGDLTIQWQ